MHHQPKLENHMWSCGCEMYTCIDCSQTFSFQEAKVSIFRFPTCLLRIGLPHADLAATTSDRNTCYYEGHSEPTDLLNRLLMQAHTTCVTEHEKYALGATKPGGYAANGYPGDAQKQQQKSTQEAEPTGLQFLATRAPWRCRCPLCLNHPVFTALCKITAQLLHHNWRMFSHVHALECRHAHTVANVALQPHTKAQSAARTPPSQSP
jgi:hypothetical protein